jgi:hypothetical protein
MNARSQINSVRPSANNSVVPSRAGSLNSVQSADFKHRTPSGVKIGWSTDNEGNAQGFTFEMKEN